MYYNFIVLITPLLHLLTTGPVFSGDTLKEVRSSFRKINLLTSSQSGEITPLLVKIKASLLHQINQRLSEMVSIFSQFFSHVYYQTSRKVNRDKSIIIEPCTVYDYQIAISINIQYSRLVWPGELLFCIQGWSREGPEGTCQQTWPV